MKSTIKIPKLCKVGFNERKDTYTGRLGFIINHDGKKWCSEKSWNNWIETYQTDEEYQIAKKEDYLRKLESHTQLYYNYLNSSDSFYTHSRFDGYRAMTLEEYLKNHNITTVDEHTFKQYGKSNDPKIIPFEFENVVMEGFVLNKDAGGVKHSWSHNTRLEKVRVYDPRDFEIEISIPNLLYILTHTSSIKGKGLEGKFIYGWDGKNLVLLPENSPEFEEMVEYTKMINMSVKKSELVIGGVYLDSENCENTYMGEFITYNNDGTDNGKELWFYSIKKRYSWSIDTEPMFINRPITSLKKFSRTNDDYHLLSEKFQEEHGNKFTPKNVEFEILTEEVLTSWIPTQLGVSWVYSKNDQRSYFDVYLKNKKGKVKKHMLYLSSYLRNNNDICTEYPFDRKSSYLKISKNELFHISSIKQLLNNYQLWQPKLPKTTD